MKTLFLPASALLLAVACRAAPPDTAATAVVPLRYAVAEELASTLSQVEPRLRIVADPRTNSLVIGGCTPGELQALQARIAQLDVQMPAGR